MSIISKQANPAFSEDQLKDWIRTQEATFGEILRIGNEDAFTLGSFSRFDPAHPRPTVEADLVQAPADAPNHEGELCRGQVFIEHALTDIIVFRPAA